MELAKIISVSGKPGLFEIIGNSKNALIVSSIGEGKRQPVLPTERVSSLDEISIFTEDDDLPLAEVLIRIREMEKGGPAIEPKSENKELFSYMEKVLPDYDKDRVYASDLKKLFTWYNILQAADMIKDLKVEEEEVEDAPAGKEEKKENEE